MVDVLAITVFIYLIGVVFSTAVYSAMNNNNECITIDDTLSDIFKFTGMSWVSVARGLNKIYRTKKEN